MSQTLQWMTPAIGGEFVQGLFRDHWVQIAAPIDHLRWAVAHPEATEPAQDATNRGRSWRKVEAGLALVTRRHQRAAPPVAIGGADLPRGAGMGSSTADIAVAVAAVSAALGEESPATSAVEACLAVEPTNGSVLPGLVLFDHRAGAIREPLGEPPPLDLVVIRPPGFVDTERFNRRLPHRVSNEARVGWEKAFELCAAGIARGDVAAVAHASRRSAELAHHVGAPPVPHALTRCAEATRALGWLRAHSGTVWSLMYPSGDAPDTGEVREIWETTAGPSHVLHGTLCSGGIVSETVLHSPWDAVIIPPQERGPTEDRSNAGAAPPL